MKKVNFRRAGGCQRRPKNNRKNLSGRGSIPRSRPAATKQKSISFLAAKRPQAAAGRGL